MHSSVLVCASLIATASWVQPFDPPRPAGPTAPVPPAAPAEPAAKTRQSAKEIAAPLPEFLSQIGPMVAKVMGRPLPEGIVIRSAGAADVEHALIEENIHKITLRSDLTHDEARAKYRDKIVSESLFEIAMFSSSAMGKYAFLERTILIQPELQEKMLKRLLPGLTPLELRAERDRALAIAVAHEWAHVLQHAELPMDKYLLLAEGEDALTHKAASEGQAVLVQELIAAQLAQADSAYTQSSKNVLKFIPGGRDTSSTALAIDPKAAQVAQSYTGGYAYMKRIFDKGGMEATWAALKNPPASMQTLLSEDSKFDDARSKALATAMCDPLTAALTKEVRVTCVPRSSATLLSREFSKLPAARREELSNAAIVSVMIGGSDRSMNSKLVGAVIVLADESSAQAYLDIIRGGCNEAIAAMSLERNVTQFTIDGVTTEKMRGAPKGTPLTYEFLTARHGTLVLFLTTIESNADIVPAVEVLAKRVIRVVREQRLFTETKAATTGNLP